MPPSRPGLSARIGVTGTGETVVPSADRAGLPLSPSRTPAYRGQMPRGEVFPIINCADLASTRAWYKRVLTGRLAYQFPDEDEAQYLTLRTGVGQVALGNGTGPAMYGGIPRRPAGTRGRLPVCPRSGRGHRGRRGRCRGTADRHAVRRAGRLPARSGGHHAAGHSGRRLATNGFQPTQPGWSSGTHSSRVADQPATHQGALSFCGSSGRAARSRSRPGLPIRRTRRSARRRACSTRGRRPARSPSAACGLG